MLRPPLGLDPCRAANYRLGSREVAVPHAEAQPKTHRGGRGFHGRGPEGDPDRAAVRERGRRGGALHGHGGAQDHARGAEGGRERLERQDYGRHRGVGP